jgi:hypothetical protein
VIFRGERKHLDYWVDHSLPIILVLYNPSDKACYWTRVDRDNTQSTGSGWKVEVPKYRVLSAESRDSLVELASGKVLERRYRKLALDHPLMEHLENGGRLLVEGGQWVNKSSGRSELKLIQVDDNGDEVDVQEWAFILAPNRDFEDVVRHIFPWADVVIDEEFYEDFDDDRFDDECGIWDSEDHRYIGHWLDRDEWLKGQPRIRPYENTSGEFDAFRFELILNKLGNAFSPVSEYLETGEFAKEEVSDSDWT